MKNLMKQAISQENDQIHQLKQLQISFQLLLKNEFSSFTHYEFDSVLSLIAGTIQMAYLL